MKTLALAAPAPETLRDELDSEGRRMLVPLVSVFARPGDVDLVLRELVSRLDALLGDGRGTAHDARPVTRVGELCVDPGARRVTVAGKEALLTGMEFRLLVTLLERRDRVLTRGELLRDVWESSALTFTRTVDVHVQRLRNKIGSAGSYIQTVRGAGYRFSERVPATAGER